MNEPERRQPEGRIARRRSTRVDRQELPHVAARERVAKILRIHDLEESLVAFDELSDSDYTIVRLIAREGVASGLEPALRYKAIAALGSKPSTENVNSITDLAQFGEDFYVRGHALLALGHTGMYAHLGVIGASLEADEPFERNAATRAVAMLAERTSGAAVRAHSHAVGGPRLLNRVDAILTSAQQRQQARPDKRRETAVDPPPTPGRRGS